MTEIKTRLQKIRYEALTEISGILTRHQGETPDFTFGGSTPIVLADEYDDNKTFTLDSVSRDKHGNLLFDSSSCCSDRTDTEESIPTDALLDIAEFISANEDSIWDSGEHREKALKKAYNDIWRDYNESDVCIAEVLASTPVSKFDNCLTAEDWFRIYCNVMNLVEHDEFFRQNKDEYWRENIITGERKTI